MKKLACFLAVVLILSCLFAGCRNMEGNKYGNVSRTDDGEVNGTNAYDPDEHSTSPTIYGTSPATESTMENSDTRSTDMSKDGRH